MEKVDTEKVEQEIISGLKKIGSNTKIGKKYGCSPSMASRILHGHRAPTEAMLKDFGYKCIVEIVHTRKYYIDN